MRGISCKTRRRSKFIDWNAGSSRGDTGCQGSNCSNICRFWWSFFFHGRNTHANDEHTSQLWQSFEQRDIGNSSNYRTKFCQRAKIRIRGKYESYYASCRRQRRNLAILLRNFSNRWNYSAFIFFLFCEKALALRYIGTMITVGDDKARK